MSSQSISSGIESTSSISDLSTARQSLIDTIPQNLYSTAQRYQQTNKQKLLRKLQTSVKTRRNKIFYGFLCIIVFVLSYQWILYLMQDLHSHYNYNKPFFIQYISYSLYSIIIGFPLIKPLWIIADKHHKSLINKHNIIISNQYNNPHYTSTPYKFNTHKKKAKNKNKPHFTFGFGAKSNSKTSTKPCKTQYKCEKKLSSTHSDINSTNSYDYEYDEEYDEYDGDSLLNDTTTTHNKPSRSHNHTHRDSTTELTELGMLSEISFNNIHDTQPSIYKDSYDDNDTNFSHSKQSNNTFTNKNGLLHPYFKEGTQTSSNSNLLKTYRQTKSECGPLLDKHEDGTGISLSLEIKPELKDINKIIVTSNRDISRIPQSVYFELDLPHRAFGFFFKNIGLRTFVFLFVINSLASVLWMLSIGNSINIHFEEFYIENSIHCTRVVICYFLSVICFTNMTSILNLMHCQHLFCLSMLIVGLFAILANNYYVFEKYTITQLVILGLTPLFNGILFMYLQHISSEYFYKKNFYMFLADIFFILGVNGIVNLTVMSVVLLLSDFTEIEEFVLPINDWNIIWRLLLIAFLWWMYNISLFIGITMLNSLIMGFGFALIIPCNIIFDRNIQIVNLAEDKEIYMLIGICLICLSFVIYEMQFYVWYVMYCGACRGCCVECRTSCIRWIHKKTQYKLYGQFQCCCKYRCCCC